MGDHISRTRKSNGDHWKVYSHFSANFGPIITTGKGDLDTFIDLSSDTRMFANLHINDMRISLSPYQARWIEKVLAACAFHNVRSLSVAHVSRHTENSRNTLIILIRLTPFTYSSIDCIHSKREEMSYHATSFRFWILISWNRIVCTSTNVFILYSDFCADSLHSIA